MRITFRSGRGWAVWPLVLLALGALLEAWLEKRAALASHGGRHPLHGRIDVVGSCLSAACAVHCLLMPLAVTLVPFGALAFLADEAFERGLIISTVGLAAASFCWGSRQHRRWRALMILQPGARSVRRP